MSAVVVQYTQSGEAHGLVDVYTNSCEFNEFKHFSPTNKSKLEKERKEDARLVEMEYINRKGMHERLDKHYVRHAGDPIQKWHCIPGKKYTVPIGLVKEVNGLKQMQRSGLLEVDGSQVNANGAPLDSDREAEWEHRFVPTKY
jgi:hypothetical protein